MFYYVSSEMKPISSLTAYGTKSICISKFDFTRNQLEGSESEIFLGTTLDPGFMELEKKKMQHC